MHFSSHHFLWWICPKHILLNFGLRKLPKLPTVGSTQKLYHRTERRAELVTWIASSERYAQLYQNNKHIIHHRAIIIIRRDDQPTLLSSPARWPTNRYSAGIDVSHRFWWQRGAIAPQALIVHLYAPWFNEDIFDDVFLGDFNKAHGKDLGRWWNDVMAWRKRQGINGIFIDEWADASTTNLPWFHNNLWFSVHGTIHGWWTVSCEKQQSNFPLSST